MGATRDVAISRKGNVGNAPAPAHSPAVANRRTPVPPCHCERSVAISRKGNVGNAPAPAKCPRRLTVEKSSTVETARRISAPAHSPAVAHRLARGGSAPFAVKHYAAGRGRPALPTASPRIGYAVISTEAVAKWRPPREKCHRSNTKTPNTRPRRLCTSPAVALRLARSGSPPSVHYFTIKRIKRQKELIIFS